MTIIFAIAFILSFLSYTIHTITHALEFRDREVPKFVDKYFHTIVHFGYLAWIIMLFTDPVRFDVPLYMIVIGIIIGTLGLITVLSAMKARKAGGGKLVTTGVYSKFRHPMYIGMTLIYLGYPLATGSLLTLLSAIIWISQMIIWKYWEETELELQFGEDYKLYKIRTIF
ncbi:methyltransferase family protein [Candidatus Margulisiibacteriota bacterium]